MDEIIRFNNILYRFVGILTHMETPYYVVERIDEAVYNVSFILPGTKITEKRHWSMRLRKLLQIWSTNCFVYVKDKEASVCF